MTADFIAQRRVEFADTDAAGIMHFSAFFRLMEEAEHEWLRACGLSVVLPDGEGKLSWPRVAARCDFLQPARFEDVLQVAVSIQRMGEKSITYAFSICRGETLLARGEMTSVCCRILPGQPPESVAIPAAIRSRLTPTDFVPKPADERGASQR